MTTPDTHLGRRALLGGLGSAAVLGLTSRGADGAPATAPSALTATAAERPNILLVVVDDLGWGEVGAYGQEVLDTPVLDRIAADGVRFDQAYATPTCAPTRCNLFTGLHTGHARVKNNASATAGFRTEDVTVAEVLKGAGYATAIIGKYGFGTPDPTHPSHANNQGFDHFFGYVGHRDAHDYWPTVLYRNGDAVHYPENDGADVTYAGTLITDEALAWLDGQVSGQPWFLDVSYTTPHAPNEIPSDAPYSDRAWPEGERNHAAQVTWTDTQVGLLLDKLRERGLADDTLVVVVSDNGPHKEGAGYTHVGSTLPHDPEFFDSNGPLRGIKRDVYEGGIRVPMVALPPASLTGTRAGEVLRTPIAVWDLLPTFADLAGAAVPEGIDGISFAPTFRGEEQPEHDHLYWLFLEGGRHEAVRFGQWKAVRHNDRPTELYRLNKDLSETTDVATANPSVVREAERLMAQAVA